MPDQVGENEPPVVPPKQGWDRSSLLTLAEIAVVTFIGLAGLAWGMATYFATEAVRKEESLNRVHLLQNEAWDLIGGRPGSSAIEPGQRLDSQARELARRKLEEAERIIPNHPETRAIEGYMAQQAEDWSGAEDKYLQAIRLGPERSMAHLGLGNLRAQEGQRKALELYRTAISRWPTRPGCYTNAGDASLELGKLGDAEQYFLQAIQRQADYVPAHLRLMWVYERQKRRAEAEIERRILYALQDSEAEAAPPPRP